MKYQSRKVKNPVDATDLGPLQDDDRGVDDELDALQLPQMMAVDGRANGVHLADKHVVAEAGVSDAVRETTKLP